MTRLDPRAQLAWLMAIILGVLLGGDAGLLMGGGVTLVALARAGGGPVYVRMLVSLLPLVIALVLVDTLAGRPDNGARVAGRLVVLASIGFAFARVAEAEAMIAGLRALGAPYSLIFVLVVGARFVPTTAAEVSNLRDAARLRGVQLDGPVWRQLAGWRLLLVPLLVSTIRRGLQLGEAMEARAFAAGPNRTVRYRLAWRRRDTLALALAAAYCGMLMAHAFLTHLG